MEAILNVDMDTAHIKANIGTLFVSEARGDEYYIFKYSDEWLFHDKTFSIDPSLPLIPGSQHSNALWGAFQDISPDSFAQWFNPPRN